MKEIPAIVLNCFELSRDSFISELTPDLFEIVPYVNAEHVQFYTNLLEELIQTRLINDRFDSVFLKQIKAHFDKATPGKVTEGLDELIKSREEREKYWQSCSIQDDIHLTKPL